VSQQFQQADTADFSKICSRIRAASANSRR